MNKLQMISREIISILARDCLQVCRYCFHRKTSELKGKGNDFSCKHYSSTNYLLLLYFYC